MASDTTHMSAQKALCPLNKQHLPLIILKMTLNAAELKPILVDNSVYCIY